MKRIGRVAIPAPQGATRETHKHGGPAYRPGLALEGIKDFGNTEILSHALFYLAPKKSEPSGRASLKCQDPSS